MTIDDDIRAFLRVIADSCTNCNRRGLGYCDTCEATRAKRLLDRVNSKVATSPAPVELDYFARCARIVSIIREARRPIPASLIDISDHCSKKTKYWTLRRLVQTHRIVMTFDGTRYLFSLPKRTKTKKRKTTWKTTPQRKRPRLRK